MSRVYRHNGLDETLMIPEGKLAAATVSSNSIHQE